MDDDEWVDAIVDAIVLSSGDAGGVDLDNEASYAHSPVLDES